MEYVKNEENNSKIYKSNVAVGNMDFFEQLDRIVAILAINKNIEIKKALHICITKESLNIAKKELDNEEKIEIVKVPLGLAIDNVIHQDNYEALIIYGLFNKPAIIIKEDFKVLEDIIDTYCILHAVSNKTLEKEKAFELLKNKDMYIIGTLPTNKMKPGDKFGFEIMKRKNEQEEYETIKCFITKESANKYNANKHPITPIKLIDIFNLFENIIIEPHRSYWAEFRKKDLK